MAICSVLQCLRLLFITIYINNGMSDVLWNYSMNDTIPSEWIRRNTVRTHPPLANNCPGERNYCWSVQDNLGALTRLPINTTHYYNITITYSIQTANLGIFDNCYIEYATDGDIINFSPINSWVGPFNANLVDEMYSDWINVEDNSVGISIRLRSTTSASVGTTFQCYWNEIKLEGDLITMEPTTSAPTTSIPTSSTPTSSSPTTSAPSTETPTTLTPTTSSPVTATPTTLTPVTNAPTTIIPTISAPTIYTTVQIQTSDIHVDETIASLDATEKDEDTVEADATKSLMESDLFLVLVILIVVICLCVVIFIVLWIKLKEKSNDIKKNEKNVIDVQMVEGNVDGKKRNNTVKQSIAIYTDDDEKRGTMDNMDYQTRGRPDDVLLDDDDDDVIHAGATIGAPINTSDYDDNDVIGKHETLGAPIQNNNLDDLEDSDDDNDVIGNHETLGQYTK